MYSLLTCESHILGNFTLQSTLNYIYPSMYLQFSFLSIGHKVLKFQALKTPISAFCVYYHGGHQWTVWLEKSNCRSNILKILFKKNLNDRNDLKKKQQLSITQYTMHSLTRKPNVPPFLFVLSCYQNIFLPIDNFCCSAFHFVYFWILIFDFRYSYGSFLYQYLCML